MIDILFLLDWWLRLGGQHGYTCLLIMFRGCVFENEWSIVDFKSYMSFLTNWIGLITYIGLKLWRLPWLVRVNSHLTESSPIDEKKSEWEQESGQIVTLLWNSLELQTAISASIWIRVMTILEYVGMLYSSILTHMYDLSIEYFQFSKMQIHSRLFCCTQKDPWSDKCCSPYN